MPEPGIPLPRQSDARLVKLVRDDVDEVCGKTDVVFGPLPSQRDYLKALRRKLIEEAIEYLEDPSVSELADVLEVVYALAQNDLSVTFADLDAECVRKRTAVGGFVDGIGMYTRPTGRAR